MSETLYISFRPLQGWDGEPTPDRQRRARILGRATYEGTVEKLTHEVLMLGSSHVVIQLDIDEQDIRRDGMPRARAVARTPGVAVSFESAHGPLRYATDVFDHWHHNLRAIAIGLEGLRRFDRYGLTRRGEQYAGWRQLHSGADDEATVERGRAIIRGAGGNVVEALKAAHPDRGGNPVDFRSVMLAREAG